MTFSSGIVLPKSLTITGGTSNQGITFNVFNQNLTLIITNKAALEAAITLSIVIPIIITISIIIGICIILIIIAIILIIIIASVLSGGVAVAKVLKPIEIEVIDAHLDI
jgi:hypothetical protein